jgi:hypothetical protein
VWKWFTIAHSFLVTGAFAQSTQQNEGVDSQVARAFASALARAFSWSALVPDPVK